MFVGTGEPVFTPTTGGEWDLVGAVLVLGAMLLLALGVLFHAKGRGTATR